MYKNFRLLPVFFGVFLCANGAYAKDCLSYKITPKVVINTPEYTKQVVQPAEHMNLMHGNVVATLVNNYDIVADFKQTDGGYCVWLKSVNATIGYSDFLVQIDVRHDKNSCSYNAILAHENRHIDAYLSVIDDNKKLLHESLYSGAAAIMPIFVASRYDVDNAVEKLNHELQTHPDIILAIQKIHADEEIKNKYIDANEDNRELEKCTK